MRDLPPRVRGLLIATALVTAVAGWLLWLAPDARAGTDVVRAAAPPPGPAWSAPLQPLRVVRGFAPPQRRWEAGHRGVDLAGGAGQPVVAAGAGLVTFAGRLAGRGVVAVDHDGLRTTYEPVEPAVSVGDPVEAGALLGVLAEAGWHCADPCLHWGLRRGATYLDPLRLLRPAVVRLLPVSGTGQARGAARAAADLPTAPVASAPDRRGSGAARGTRTAGAVALGVGLAGAAAAGAAAAGSWTSRPRQ